MNLEDTYETLRLAEEIAAIARKQISEYGARKLDSMTPLTYSELDALLDTEMHEEHGTVVWVQFLPHKFVYAAVLDWFDGEVIAVYGTNIDGADNQLYGRDYGTEWLAYLERPEFKED